MRGPEEFDLLTQFFEKPACQRATEPLREGVEILVRTDSEGDGWTLKKQGKMLVLPQPPTKPDMTFQVPLASLQTLAALETDDIGVIGIEILKLMAHEDASRQIRAKVHIGPMDLFLKGYLSVLPLGGSTVMKFLATKGFTGISKIKEGISRLRG